MTFTTLFPNAAQPVHGIFVEARLRHLVAGGGVEARVVAPVPWFPFRHPAFKSYAAFARAPRHEHRHGLEIAHPRYVVIPKVGSAVTPATLFAGARPAIRDVLLSGFDFDLIDAHYAYPDGVAAVMLARHFGKPVTVTARGTDLNLIPRFRAPRRMIRWAAAHADGLIAVCQALKDVFVGLGIDAERVRVLRNGVDLALFRPVDPGRVRKALGLCPPVLLSVGALIPRKGHDLTIRALPRLPGATLVIAGEGPEEGRLRRLAAEMGVDERVRFLGRVAHGDLPALYSAADLLVLASSREGWANVLLEAIACGTPVVASNVWGTPEVVRGLPAGLLLDDRTPDAIAAAVQRLLARMPDGGAVRAYAERFGWDETTRGQIELFREIAERPAPGRAAPAGR